MSTQPLPIGVMIPTLNCDSLIADHVDSINLWADLAAEVVVVDSESTDGTVDYLRKNLVHPNIRFLQHPRGLYQSWNFGNSQLSQTYTYVSTVGDSMTREGLQELHDIAVRHQTDAAVSKPRFIDFEGNPEPDMDWPVDDLLRHFRDADVVVIGGALLHFFTLGNRLGAIIGSSASNLYRTECLQARPFSADYGTVGDDAWCPTNALDCRLAFTTKRFSTFRSHPKAYAAKEYAVTDLREKLFALGCDAFAQRASQSPEFKAENASLKIEELIARMRDVLNFQDELERHRDSRWPWVLNPRAWRARRERERSIDGIAELKRLAALKIRSGRFDGCYCVDSADTP